MYKSKKGITLIALVVTIIVLLILAGIAISMLTGENSILVKSKESAAANSLGAAKDKVNLEVSAMVSDYYKGVYVDKTISSATGGTNYKTLTTYIQEQLPGIKTKIDTNDVTYAYADGKITLTYTPDGTKVETTLISDGKVTWGEITTGTAGSGTGGSGDTGGTGTGTTYSVGQTVTLGTGANAEDFYVIKDNGDTVTLITKLCVETTNYTQSTSADKVVFDDDYSTDVYTNASIKDEVDNYVTAFKTRWQKTNANVEGRLLTIEDLDMLGAGEPDSYAGKISLENCPDFISYADHIYWTMSPHAIYKTNAGGLWVYVVGDKGRAEEGEVSSYYSYYVRPVITISKSDL